MRFSNSSRVVFFLALAVSAAFLLSGCATCNTCGSAPKTPSVKGMLHGEMGCDDCEQSSSPLLVEKDMPRQVVVGQPYTYTIRVTNRAECGLDDVIVIETVPENYSMDSAAPQTSNVTGRVATWNLGYLKPGETQVITITGTAKAGGSIVSCTKASYNPLLCMGPGIGIPAILLEVIDTEDPVQVGGPEKYYVTVTNQGNAPDTNIVVRVQFEENFDFVSSEGPTPGTPEGTKGVVFAPLGSLAPGQKATWAVHAKAVKEGDHRTAVKLTSDAIQRSVDETEATRVY